MSPGGTWRHGMQGRQAADSVVGQAPVKVSVSEPPQLLDSSSWPERPSTHSTESKHLSPELQLYFWTFICLLDVPTWVFCKHLKLPTSKTKLMICNLKLAFPSVFTISVKVATLSLSSRQKVSLSFLYLTPPSTLPFTYLLHQQILSNLPPICILSL